MNIASLKRVALLPFILFLATILGGLFVFQLSFEKRNPKPVGAQTYYGVHIDSAGGNVSGFAWSDGVGWIDFTNVAYSGGNLTGTAEIVEVTGLGGDGVIQMQGDCSPSCGGYGVSVNGSNQLVGYAWSETIGWIEFSHAFGSPTHNPGANPSVRGWAWNDNIGWIQLADQPATCGNAILEGAESCDDGNTTGGDGCSPICGVEVCGNSIVDPGEDCDDGNTSDGDGCSAICQVESMPGPCSASSRNTCSWAWSDTMGWISHNVVDDPVTPIFGLHIPPDGGALEGHAWNDLLGYIDFSTGSYDDATGEISGTAQILDLAGLGTVTLRGDCTPTCGGYGLSVVGNQVTGFAWNDTIGWIDFQPALGGVNFSDAENPSLSGWAWNDSYGWIAVRFTNYELDWGVNLEPTGNLIGYAWNDNMGWLNYDHPGPYPAAPTHSARWDSVTEEVSGWVYADGINSGGADPWILLRDNGAIPYGVSMDGTTGLWSGWAWSDVFGWVAYDHTYGEVTTEFGGGGPATPILDTPLDCVDTYTINPTAGLTPALDWSDYGALDGTTQLNFQVQVDTDPLFSAPIIDETVNSVSSIYTVGLGLLNYNVTYYWRVRVESSDNEWSEWGELGPAAESNCFRTPLHAPPDCSFTMNPAPAVVDQETQFTDTSTLYGGATGDFWDWDYGDGNTQFGSDPIENQNPAHTYTSTGDVTVTFRHVDSDGYECTTTSDEQVVLQLPEFRRVIPR